MPKTRPPVTIASLMSVSAVVALILASPRLMEEAWFWVACFACLACLFGRKWIIHPWHLHSNSWTGVELDYRPLEPNDPETPAEVTAWNEAAVADLTALGFVVKGHFRLIQEIWVPIDGYLTLFENPGTSDSARLIISMTPGRAATPIFVFYTHYQDRKYLATSDNPGPRIYPFVAARRRSMAFPQVGSARCLYEIHQARADAEGRSNNLIQNPPAFLKESSEREHAGWVAKGYCFVDASGTRLRPTWKGAIIAGWKLTKPMPAILLALKRRKAKRESRRLGIDLT